VTVTTVPATASCADRDVDAVLAVTEKETVVVPVPLVTAGVSQETLSETCHVQLEPAVTVTVPVEAPAGSVTTVGDTL
jgi:hypothetical protein